MVTLCIRYRLDPERLDAFRTYAEALRPVVDRCGGKFVDYYLPTKLAGPTDTGIGLIDFADLQSYQRYRAALAADPDGVEIARQAAQAGCILGEDRSFLDRAKNVAGAPAAEPPAAEPPAVGPPATSGQASSPVERIYFAWNDALAANDATRLLSLYAEDAVFESPLTPYLLDRPSGVLRGHAELRPLFDQLATRKPRIRQYYRTSYLTDGKRLIWEYPRAAPAGEQMDFAEAMELNNDGLIQRHCVYWGWFGVGVLQRDEYYRD